MTIRTEPGLLFSAAVLAGGSVDTDVFQSDVNAGWLKFFVSTNVAITARIYRRSSVNTSVPFDPAADVAATEESRQTIERPGGYGYFLRLANSGGTDAAVLVDTAQGGVA